MIEETGAIGSFSHKGNDYEVLVKGDKFEIKMIKNVAAGVYKIGDIAQDLKVGDKVFVEMTVSKETNSPHLLPGFKNPFQIGNSDPNMYAPKNVRVIVE